jgi:hypothetical protein
LSARATLWDDGDSGKGIAMEDHGGFADTGLWIYGVSNAVGEAIAASVLAFRKQHQLPDSAWHVRAYGLPGGVYIDVWIGKPPNPTYREPFTVANSTEAGEKVRSLLEELIKTE